MTIAIHTWEDSDLPRVLALWNATLGGDWPLDEATFRLACCTHGGADRFINLVAKNGEQLVGYLCAQVGEGTSAGILAVTVHPAFQRQRIGTALLHRCACELSERKIQNVRVGSGGISYLWPGVPKTSAAGIGFITKIGWTIREELYDMVADLEGLTTEQLSSFVTQDVHELRETEVDDLLNLLSESFASWREPYEVAISEGRFSDVSVAVSREGELAGCVLAFTNADKNYDNGLAWRGVLGAQMGGFAVLGVKESLRGHGIGLSLAAKVTLDLKLRGVTTSLAGYTYLEDLYGKIGYRVWRRWAMTNGLSPENILHATQITKLLDR